MLIRALPLLVCAVAAVAAERRFDFNDVRENETPSGFRSAVTGRGPLGTWKVRVTDVPPVIAPFSARSPRVYRRGVLAQLSQDRDETRAPMLVYESEPFSDFTFTTRFKIIGGEVEQMAGLAFRIRDEKNYYYVRANAKEHNVAFLRYVAGELIGPISAPANVRTGEWHQISVECRGSKLRTSLDGREIIPWTEPSLVPFPDGSSRGVFPSGKVAFWTKADSLVYFTDSSIEFTPHELFAQALIREAMQVNPRLKALRIFGLTTNESGTKIIGSTDENEIGQPGNRVERDCIEKGGNYFGKGKEVAVVTMPLHDRNGEIVGAVRVTMTTFLGQMERTALARALPIVKSIEKRISSAKELMQ